ncbi:MAG: hypothetical protein LBQ68_10110, partial [Clostridiales bacterium]|nr:hypothetical protein [Clostridiales bacterium]
DADTRNHAEQSIERNKKALSDTNQYFWELIALIDERNRLRVELDAQSHDFMRMEEIDEDLAGFLKDYKNLEHRIIALSAELESIRDRLRQNGYDDIVVAINDKSRRMKEITACRDILIHALGKYELQRAHIEADTQKRLAEKSEQEKNIIMLSQALKDEAALGLTDAVFDPEDRESVNKALNYLEFSKQDFAGRSLQEMELIIHNRLFERAMYLSKLHPQVTERFSQPPGLVTKIRRMEINCELDGELIGLKELYRRMCG